MKNYQYKLILAFFIIGIIIISALGIIFINYGHIDIFLAKRIIYITLAIFTLICIFMAIFTKKKIIEPMSRMLKSAVNYKELENVSDDNDEIAELVNNLRKSLKDANDQKRQTDTILTHMTDGVISFDMNGKVSYINPAAISMLNLKESSNTFEKIFSKYEDINMEKIIYLDTWTSSEKKIETEQGSLSLF